MKFPGNFIKLTPWYTGETRGEPVMRELRDLAKPVDELAKGKPMKKS